MFSDSDAARRRPRGSSGWAFPRLVRVGIADRRATVALYHGRPRRSLATGVFLTGAVKVIVGRHRPSWSEDTNTPGSRRSFPSGHSTQAWAIATYSALYLRGHVFDKYRGDSVLPWYEALTYGGIAAGAAFVSGERVVHNRHHLSDVVIGGIVGGATSACSTGSRQPLHKAQDARSASSSS